VDRHSTVSGAPGVSVEKASLAQFPVIATTWRAQGGSRASETPSAARAPLRRPSTPTD
jgi:hypothetical protein